MEKKGRLFVISGPSGVGKGTIVSELTERLGDSVRLSISATTRQPREGDRDGVDYYFLSEEEFLSKVEKGEFLEYASVHGNYYGTPKPPVQAALEAGLDVILEIDVQGAMQVKENYPEGVFIFILPPSITELRARLAGRGTESEQDMERRMGMALQEIEYLDQYDYGVLNHVLETAVKDVLSIIGAEHCRVGGHVAQKIREELRSAQK